MIVAVIATVCHLTSVGPGPRIEPQVEVCEEAAIDNGGAYGICPTMPVVIEWLTDTFGPDYTLQRVACYPGGRPLPGKA